MNTHLETDRAGMLGRANPGDGACRLCGGRVEFKFAQRLLAKHQVSYWRCEQCESLQTDPPHWLDEAYASNLAFLDTFAAQRTLNNLAASFLVSKFLRLPNVVDFGGSDGILCRLLRDLEVNCCVLDKYAQPKYAQGFDKPMFDRPDLVLAFEVLEHFAHPRWDLAEIFKGEPRAVLLSTQTYSCQGVDWPYLAPETGQHVFFYSESALRMIGERHGYVVQFSGMYTLLVHPELRQRARMCGALFGRYGLRLLRTAVNMLPARGANKDFDMLRAAYRARTDHADPNGS
nr:class I SAM-dependent methyltransferase [Variovorax boronicumulans]